MARTTTQQVPLSRTVSSPRGGGRRVLPVPLLGGKPSHTTNTASPQHDVYRVEYQTYCALPAAERAYSEYDFALLAEIITLAEFNAVQAHQHGAGTGEVTLQRLLRAYEAVLPRHGVKPEEDIFYYRFLLKLSLDPDSDWWGKFYREARGTYIRAGAAPHGRTSLNGGGPSPSCQRPREDLIGSGRSASASRQRAGTPMLLQLPLLPLGQHSNFFAGSPSPAALPRQQSADSLEGEAFTEFSRLARAFRAWWRGCREQQSSRAVQEHAASTWMLATTHSEARLLRHLFNRWRGRGSLAVARAIRHWAGSALLGYFRWWRLVTRQMREKADRGDAHSAATLHRRVLHAWQQTVREARGQYSTAHLYWCTKGRGRLLQHWRKVAHQQHLNREAGYAIQDRAEARVQWGVLSYWRHIHATRARHERIMAGARVKLRSRRLSAAWAGWMELLEGWHGLQTTAEGHRRKGTRRLLRELVGCWRGWKDKRQGKAAREWRALWHVKRALLVRVLRAWRQHAQQFRRDYIDMTIIMQASVARSISVAMGQWRHEYSLRRRSRAGAAMLAKKRSLRIMRHWKVLAAARRQRRALLTTQLGSAHRRRRQQLLEAWRMVAAALAENRRLVTFNRARVQRRLVLSVLGSWRDVVLRRATKRMRLLSAVTHWSRDTKSRVMRVWDSKLAYWRRRRALKAQGVTHYQTRLMDLAMGAWLLLWQGYQVHLSRAMALLVEKQGMLMHAMLRHWQQEAMLLQIKHYKTRRALAHWMANSLGACLYGWHFITQHRLHVKAQILTAADHWGRRVASAALQGWHVIAACRADHHERAAAYQALLMDRRLAAAFVALRAHAIRKRRNAAVVAHRAESVARAVLHTLRLRVVLAAAFHARLLRIGAQLAATVMREGLDAWMEHWLKARAKKVDIYRALGFYFEQSKRAAFNALRWHYLQQQMVRACLLKRNLALASGILRQWYRWAGHQSELRERFALIKESSTKRVLHEQLGLWRRWSTVHLGKRDKVAAAARFWAMATRRRAWDGWREHCSFAARANRAMVRMINHRLGLQLGGWYKFMQQRRAVGLQVAAVQQRWKRREMAEAFNALLGNAVIRGHKAKQLLAAGDFWMQRKGREVFQAWMEAAWTLPRARKALDLWTGHTLRLVFHQWRSVAARRRGVRATGAIVARRWRALELSGALLGWLGRAEEGRLKKSRLLRALAHWHNHNITMALKGWMEVAWDKQRLRKVAGEVASRMRRRMLASLFNPWRELTTHLVAAGGHAQEMFWGVTRRLAMDPDNGMFIRWRNHAHQMHQCRGLLERVLKRHMLTAFDGWRGVKEACKQLRGASDSAVARYHGSTKVKHFKWWKALTQYLGHMDRAMAVIQDRKRGRAVRDTFCSWHTRSERALLARRHSKKLLEQYQREVLSSWMDRTVHNRQLRGKLKAAVLRLSGRQLGVAFEGWRLRMGDFIGKRSALYRALAHLRHRTLAQAFSRWWSWGVDSLRCKAALMHYFGRLQDRAWAAWAGVTSHEREGRQLSCAVLLHWSTTLRRSLCRWHHRAALASAVRQALARRLVRTAQAVLLGWWQVIQQLRHEQELLETLQQVFASRLAFQALQAWRDNAKARAMLVRIYQRRALLSWHETAVYWAAKRRVLARACAAMLAGKLARALRGWRARVEHLAELRRLLQRAVVSFTSARLARAFRGWQERVQHWSARSEQLRRAATALMNGRMARALRGWHERVTYWAEQRSRLHRASIVLMYGKLARIFQEWQHYAEVRQVKATVFGRKQRALQGALLIGEQIRERRRRDTLAACLAAWRLQSSVFREVARRFAMCSARSLKQAFRHWRQHTLGDREKNVRLASDFYRTAYLSKALAAWLEVLDLAGLRREALRHVLALVVHSEKQVLLQQHLQRWAALPAVHRSQRHKAERLRDALAHRLLGRVFDVWLRFKRAMAADVDPGSPFLSPRSGREDRLLVRRVAAMAGSVEVEPGSDASSEVFGNVYVSDRLLDSQRAKEKLQTYLQFSSASRRGDSTVAAQFKQYDDELEQPFRMMSVAASMRRPRPQGSAQPPSTSHQLPAGHSHIPAVRLAPVFDESAFDDRVELNALYEEAAAAHVSGSAVGGTHPATPAGQFRAVPSFSGFSGFGNPGPTDGGSHGRARRPAVPGRGWGDSILGRGGADAGGDVRAWQVPHGLRRQSDGGSEGSDKAGNEENFKGDWGGAISSQSSVSSRDSGRLLHQSPTMATGPELFLWQGGPSPGRLVRGSRHLRQ